MQTMIKVGQPWPGDVPKKEGAHLELAKDGLTLLIQFPGLTRPELQAFKKSFRRYAYIESATPVPIALWVFEFPPPFGALDVNFNARLVHNDWITDYLDTTGGVKNRLLIHVFDGQILRANKLIGLDPDAVELFHATIKKQISMKYSRYEYERYLGAMYAYNWEEMMQMGQVFRHDKR